MTSRLTALAAPLALLAALAALAAATPSALAHGEEEEAAAEAPARTLVQQALALLTQQENEAEAQEKLELALESKEQKDVDIPAVRKALTALEKDDHELAEENMNAALGAGEAAAEEEVPEEALEHAPAFDPDRGSEEWIGLGVGIVVILVGTLGLVAIGRRRPAG